MLKMNIQLFGECGADSGYAGGTSTSGGKKRSNAFFDKTSKYQGMTLHEFENAIRDKKRGYIGLFDSNIEFSSISSVDKAMYGRYKGILRDLSPGSLEDFVKIKYNNSAEWEQLKYQYRTLNRYGIDGDVPAKKIIELDNAACYTKKTKFDYSAFSDKEKSEMESNISNRGNAATMEFEGKIYFSHSRFGVPGSLEYSIYKGDYPAVALSDNRIFTVKALGDGVPRQYDTEAKFLEFVATQKQKTDKFSVTILSERHICESCQGVVEQFKKRFPNATVNIISGKRNYNNGPKGSNTWKHRKEVK